MNRKTRLRAAGGIAALLLTMAATGCGRGGETNGGGGSGGTAAPGSVKTGPGFDGTTIRLGVVTVDSGSASVIGKPLTNGNKVYFDKVNAAGGIAGKYKVELDVRDSKYEPATGVQQYQAVKGNVAMVLQILGTPIVDAIKGELARDNILIGPASLDAFWVHEPNMMPVGGPYQVQVINGIDWVMRAHDGKNKKICALTKDDAYGQTGKKGLDFAAQKFGFTVAAATTFPAGNADYTAQITQLQGAGCQVVVFVGLPAETSPVLNKAQGMGFEPMWLGQSPTWVSALATSPLRAYLEKNFYVLSEGPDWGDTSVPGMKEMVDDVAKHAPDQKPDGYFAFGYTQAKAAHQILEQAAKDGDLSASGVLAASHKIDKLTFGNTFGDYKYGPPEDRDPPRGTTVFKVDGSIPIGLKAVEVNKASDAAREYEFEAS